MKTRSLRCTMAAVMAAVSTAGFDLSRIHADCAHRDGSVQAASAAGDQLDAERIGDVPFMRIVEFPIITVGEEDSSEIEQAPDTGGRRAVNMNLVVFRPDNSKLPRLLHFFRKGKPVAAFAEDGSEALSAKELERVESVLVKTHGDSSRYELILDGKYAGVDAIVKRNTGEDNDEARLTLVKAPSDDEIILTGTMYGDVSFGFEEGKSIFIPLAIVSYVAIRIWCISRCDRCTDTCGAGNCDNNACHDCLETYACDDRIGDGQ